MFNDDHLCSGGVSCTDWRKMREEPLETSNLFVIKAVRFKDLEDAGIFNPAGISIGLGL